HSHNPVREMYVRDGTFELPGCDPENPGPVYILDAKGQLGAVVKLPDKKAAKEPITIPLKKCGTVTARFVDSEGKMMEKFRPSVELQLTPGVLHDYQSQELRADTIPMSYLDWQRQQGLKPDAKGRFTFPTLIPGATFRVIGATPSRGIFD